MADSVPNGTTEHAPAGATAQEGNVEEEQKEGGDAEEETGQGEGQETGQGGEVEGQGGEVEGQGDEVENEDQGGQVKKVKVTFHIPSGSAVTHLKPSLPSVLTEYGLQDTSGAKAPEKKKKERKARAKRRSFSEDRDSDTEKDERWGVMDRLEKVRTDLYDEYMDQMVERVANQRREIRQRSLEMERKLAEKEERERQESHHVKKRLPRRNNRKDTAFLQNLPKSDYYRILGLQSELLRRGQLKNQQQLDTFWEDLRQPDIFYAHFRVPQLAAVFGDGPPRDMPTLPPGKDYNLKAKLPPPEPIAEGPGGDFQKLPKRELTLISEVAESPRGTPRDKWAVTQGPPIRHGMEAAGRGKFKLTKQGSKKKLDDFDSRFPKVELPPLHCFTMDLSEKPPDPEEIRRQAELRSLQIGRRVYLRKLHKMHQLAMANNAAATRIIEKNKKDFGFLPEPNLGDVLSLNALLGRPEPVEFTPEPKERRISLRQRFDPSLPSPPLPPMIEMDSASLSGSEMESERVRKGKPAESPTEQKERPLSEPLPLTMDETVGNCKIIEAKCLSTLWTNYAGIGLRRKAVNS